MTTTRYEIEVIHEAHDARVNELQAAVALEVSSVGVHRSVEVAVATVPPTSPRAVTVVLGGAATAASPGAAAASAAALAAGRTVIPVVDHLRSFAAATPAPIHHLNGWTWIGASAATRLARVLLEDLGIQERQRRAFISHKRDDGLLMAEQVHDALAHNGFQPFVDRFAIRPGEPVQDVIAEALEGYAFLLLLESPLAHTSPWVFDEVEYALSHHLGIHIVTWPGAQPVAATPGLRRQGLAAGELVPSGAFQILTERALVDVVEQVEAMHAHGLVRRRTNLLTSAEEAARYAGCAVTKLPNWRLLVDTPHAGTHLVGITPRLPQAEDFFLLDRDIARLRPDRRVLVHGARALSPGRRDQLRWLIGRRRIGLVAEHEIAGYW